MKFLPRHVRFSLDFEGYCLVLITGVKYLFYDSNFTKSKLFNLTTLM